MMGAGGPHERIDERHRWELRDEGGRLVGTVVSPQELSRLEERVRELEGAVGKLQSEKDRLEKALKAHLQAKVTPMTAEEKADLDTNGFTAEQFRAEIDRLFGEPRRKEAS
jgi:predicted nuclease with TOPRIM domain